MFLLLLADHLVTIFQLYDLFQDLGIHPNILIESSKSQTSTGGGRRWWPGSARPQWSWFLANFPNSNYKRGAIVTFDMNVSGKWPEQVLKLYPVWYDGESTRMKGAGFFHSAGQSKEGYVGFGTSEHPIFMKLLPDHLWHKIWVVKLFQTQNLPFMAR